MANIRDRGYIHVYIYICDNLYVICFNEKYNMPSGQTSYPTLVGLIGTICLGSVLVSFHSSAEAVLVFDCVNNMKQGDRIQTHMGLSYDVMEPICRRFRQGF